MLADAIRDVEVSWGNWNARRLMRSLEQVDYRFCIGCRAGAPEGRFHKLDELITDAGCVA